MFDSKSTSKHEVAKKNKQTRVATDINGSTDQTTPVWTFQSVDHVVPYKSLWSLKTEPRPRIGARVDEFLHKMTIENGESKPPFVKIAVCSFLAEFPTQSVEGYFGRRRKKIGAIVA